MIQFSTYIRIKPDYEPVDALSKPPPDADYVDGYIDLAIDGVTIMDRSAWDLVDQLWAYMVNGIEDVAAGRSFFTYFPDQPLELRFDLIEPEEVRVELGSPPRNVSAVVSRRAWIEAVATEATKVLLVLGAWLPENREGYQQVIDQAAALLQRHATAR